MRPIAFLNASTVFQLLSLEHKNLPHHLLGLRIVESGSIQLFLLPTTFPVLRKGDGKRTNSLALVPPVITDTESLLDGVERGSTSFILGKTLINQSCLPDIPGCRI